MLANGKLELNGRAEDPTSIEAEFQAAKGHKEVLWYYHENARVILRRKRWPLSS
ncbi:hypothetical protein [Petrachloros mirabilis]